LCVLSCRGSLTVPDLLSYHFGYGKYGPVRRGKRLRPNIVLRVAQDEGLDPERALDAAAAVEILHNYSLVHDDIEDRDELRHGRPTLWARFGLPAALKAGDAMCAVSFLTLARAMPAHPAKGVLEMIEALHAAHLRMCHGQSLDLQFESEGRVDLADYQTMIDGKTAALFGAACELGALSAGADARKAQDVTGKTAGNDIARRKWTFPVVWSLAGPRSQARDVISGAYAAGGPIGPEQVAAVVAALEALGAREAADRAIAESLNVVERHGRPGIAQFLSPSLGPVVV
jgi:geranylgeranyl diphosphate synthase type I